MTDQQHEASASAVTAAITVRAASRSKYIGGWRKQAGFLVSGRDVAGRTIRVWVHTRDTANALRKSYLRGAPMAEQSALILGEVGR